MKRLKPAHPGILLLEEFIKPLGLTQYRVAKDAGIGHSKMSEIVHGRRTLSVEVCLRLAKYFGNTPGFWMRLQADYDLRIARRQLQPRLDKEVKPFKHPLRKEAA